MEAVRRPKYECLLFDMDDTLYPMSLGLNFACRKNIEEFMLQQLHIEADEVPRMCLELYKEHGTTMAGLKALGYDFDNDEFHAEVHGKLPYESLRPDPVLRNLLISMPQRKIIFTNADKAHATEVLKRLGLEDCFEGVICFETLNPPPRPIYQDDCTTNTTTAGVGMDDNYAPLLTTEAKTPIDNAANNNTETENDNASSHLNKQILCKPALEAVKAAIKIANVDPKRTIFFDDSARNIASGKAAGLRTVIVGSSTLVLGADHALSSIHNIKDVLPELWEDEGEHLEQVVQSTTVEAAVLA